VGRLEITGRNRNVVESHASILAPFSVVTLSPETVDPDPIHQFRQWFDEALAGGVRQPEAMTLATAARDGSVTARTVLLRGLDERGVAFFTNVESAKATQMADNPRAALVFHWREQERQVRISGPVARLSTDEATRYWNSRPRGHRIGAWASPQSQAIDLADLDARVAEVEARFAGVDPPLPPFWGGYVVAVDELELWQGRPDRLHDRVRYRRDSVGSWQRERLAP
jgi:pyridoxamine 5'-phosphate oxidase